MDPERVYSPLRANVEKVENCLDTVVDIVVIYIETYKEKWEQNTIQGLLLII